MSGVAGTTVEAIRRLIEAHLGPGARLPSEDELGRQLGVSRATVRDALARLAADGTIEKRWGIGTFVAHKPRTGFGLLFLRPGIPGILATVGGTPSVARFEYAEAPPAAELFPAFPDAPTLSMTRVFALDGVPVIATRDRVVGEVDGRRVDPEPLRSIDALVVDVLAEAGIEFSWLEVELAAGELDQAGRALFALTKPEPVIETRGVGFRPDSSRILVSRGTYRTNVVRLSLAVDGGGGGGWLAGAGLTGKRISSGERSETHDSR